jgi:hypothetical protein
MLRFGIYQTTWRHIPNDPDFIKHTSLGSPINTHIYNSISPPDGVCPNCLQDNPSARTTKETQPLYCCRGVFTRCVQRSQWGPQKTPLPTVPLLLCVDSLPLEYLCLQSLPSNDYTHYNILYYDSLYVVLKSNKILIQAAQPQIEVTHEKTCNNLACQKLMHCRRVEALAVSGEL